MQISRCVIEAVEPRTLMSRSYGIDVSHYQGTINWTTLHAQTTPYPVSFAMIKATGSDGGQYTDSQFATNVAGAAAAGELFGVYHFADPTSSTSALAQADYFLSKAKSSMTVGHLPAMLDLEKGGGTLSVAALSTWANTFCQEIYTQTGQKPFIYTSSDYAKNYVDTSVSQWPLWIAAYPSNGTNIQTYNPTVGSAGHGWTTWQFWQYSDDNYTPVYANGITAGGVDGDVYKSDAATLFSTYAIVSKAGVTQGSTAVTSGQSTAVNFGTTIAGTTGNSLSFNITNSGSATLTTSALTVPAGYTVTDPLASSIAIGGSDTLTIQQVTATNGTFAGNVSFTSNDPLASPFTFPVTSTIYTPDVTPPTVVATNFNYLTTPPTVQFAFSENVGASLSPADFTLTNTDTNTPVDFSSITYNSSTNVASMNFSHSLPDGNYNATLLGNVVSDTSGNVMTGSTSVTFFALAGDANHDGAVNIADLGILATNYGKTSGVNYSGGDFTGEGAVNIADLGILATSYGNSIAPSGSAVASYSAAVASPPAHKTTSSPTVASQVLT